MKIKPRLLATHTMVLAIACVLISMLIPVAVAVPAPRHAPPPSEAVLGPQAERLRNGLYRVTTPSGFEMTTHGADPRVLLDGHGDRLGPEDPERPPVCATGHAAHVLYGRPAFIAPDRLAAVEEEIRAHIRRMNAVVNESSLESGGPEADLKVLCDERDQIRIDSFVNNWVVGYFTTVVDAARAAGYSDPNVDYIIFYDDNFPGVCGIAQMASDDRPGPDNRNNAGGYGITYKDCWFSRTPLHENGHTQGAVQSAAPNEDGTHHCTEQFDIMCYPSTSRLCPVQWFDCGFDTYFDSAPEPGEWLHDHWNLGSRDNRYIQFADTAVETDPGAQLEFADDRPRRGERLQPTASLAACSSLTGTVIKLQRKMGGAFRTVAERQLDDDCTATFSVRANFTTALFRSFWPDQHDLYTKSISPPTKIRTR